ncbi:homoaconitate hydratase [Deinococcus sp.]|uniref:LeuD/DmdB family oxidoreductase small subunit n=1 Tax=Deinococcus sp. TaxID=47478 RepID=UPI0025C725ED|nr:homoaconitate hydratase [Deinococcus sp.]
MSRVWKFGDSVNTDDILPGKFAPFMAGEDVFQTFAFHYIRPEFAGEVRPGDVLIGGKNWGLGSSREYAPQALKKLQIGAIIAPSFARIHYRNLLNLGIPAFTYDLTGLLEDGDEVQLDINSGVLNYTAQTGQARTVQLPPPPEFLREALAEGSILAFFKKHGRFPGEKVG